MATYETLVYVEGDDYDEFMRAICTKRHRHAGKWIGIPDMAAALTYLKALVDGDAPVIRADGPTLTHVGVTDNPPWRFGDATECFDESGQWLWNHLVGTLRAGYVVAYQSGLRWATLTRVSS